MIQLGQTVRDTVTGVVGVVTGRAEYLSGAQQTLVAPPLHPSVDFRLHGHWFNADRLVAVDPTAITPSAGTSPGCDLPAPRR